MNAYAGSREARTPIVRPITLRITTESEEAEHGFMIRERGHVPVPAANFDGRSLVHYVGNVMVSAELPEEERLRIDRVCKEMGFEMSGERSYRRKL
ncbi:MAG: hypothetical protein HYW25_02700 [Candidatus Aenigmarchaeota archaeon]|nr:hypothetical protein [Candidatus Aenigmarchaeota archaeon]